MMQEPTYLSQFAGHIASDTIRALRKERLATLAESKYAKYAEALQATTAFKTQHLNFADEIVEIGNRDELSAEAFAAMLEALKAFIPWKKGPFRIFGIDIDAEWQSDLKWQRLLPHIRPLKSKKIADIGCHNGYFMYRMAHHKPELVVGFEPVPKHWFNFQLLQQFAQVPQLAFEMLGVEHIDYYPQFFDSVFCLGILYHHTDPVGLLRKIRSSLVPGGELIIDCQGIPGDEPVALVPASRYARARGIWFLPTLACLSNWLHRAQFHSVSCFYAEPLSPDEQRKTEWAPIDSLQDFLDPQDPSKTVEGYPAPWRFYVKAYR